MVKKISLNGHLFPEAALINLSDEDINRLRNGIPLMTRRNTPRAEIDMKAIIKASITVKKKPVEKVKEKEVKKPKKEK